MYNLIEFYNFPILLFLEAPYKKILSDDHPSLDLINDLKKIAKIAKNILGSKSKIYELEFLYKNGIDIQYNVEIAVEGRTKKFLEYIKTLSIKKHELFQKIESNSINENDILEFQALSFGEELTYLELNFENYIKGSVK